MERNELFLDTLVGSACFIVFFFSVFFLFNWEFVHVQAMGLFFKYLSFLHSGGRDTNRKIQVC